MKDMAETESWNSLPGRGGWSPVDMLPHQGLRLVRKLVLYPADGRAGGVAPAWGLGRLCMPAVRCLLQATCLSIVGMAGKRGAKVGGVGHGLPACLPVGKAAIQAQS
jgi:hypothetical protein